MYRRSLQLLARQLVLPFTKLSAINIQKSSLCSELVQPFRQSVPCISNCRNYSKAKDTKKEKKKSTKIYEDELAEVFDTEALFQDVMRPLDSFKQELTQHVSLRSSHGVIENLKVEFEGKTYTIHDLAEVGKKNPRLYVLDVSAFPQSKPVIMKCLENSELNLNPQQEGDRIFVPLPKVTKEHRELLVKKSKTLFVKCKDSIRAVQNKYIKRLGKVDKLSDETKFRLTDQLTVLADKHIDMAEQILKTKQSELLKIE